MILIVLMSFVASMKYYENSKSRPGIRTTIFFYGNQLKYLQIPLIFTGYFCLDKYYKNELIVVHIKFKL